MPMRRSSLLWPQRLLPSPKGNRPVVATPLPDVLEPYGHLGFVRVAADAEAFVLALEAELRGESVTSPELRDGFLAHSTWDGTWQRMYDLVLDALIGRARPDRWDVPPSGMQRARH